jgi:flavin-dependent dehydrogenase
MSTSSSAYDVIIAGGGPAGSSAAIHLALRDARVLLAEQKKFPRPKLCGEFISPECAAHFERLGVADQMFASGPSRLTETVFYSRNGTNVRVPSDWFSAGGVALGLSRAEMDERLLRRAADVGVTVLEDTQVVNLAFDKGGVAGVTVKTRGTEQYFQAPITIDATGRTRSLARLAERICSFQARLRRAPMVAFKAHLRETRITPGACEIYFYRGGYGGLSSIENGLSNLCFIANARDVRSCQSSAERVMREIVCQNRRASYTLKHALVQTDWLAVSLERFGRHSAAPANGLLAIGDAASFIDPFTGSGMLMALETGEMVARIIGERLDQVSDPRHTQSLGEAYERLYEQQFSARLQLCSMLRRAAFVPGLADLAIRFFGASQALRRRVTHATRSSPKRNLPSVHAFK